MAQEPRGASGLGRNPGSLCFGRRRLGGLGSDHAEPEGGQSEEGAERGQETHRPTVGPVRTSLCLHSHLLPSSNDRVTRNPKAELGASLSPHGCNHGIHTQNKGNVFLAKYSF